MANFTLEKTGEKIIGVSVVTMKVGGRLLVKGTRTQVTSVVIRGKFDISK